jgi:hypothetical protein
VFREKKIPSPAVVAVTSQLFVTTCENKLQTDKTNATKKKGNNKMVLFLPVDIKKIS